MLSQASFRIVILSAILALLLAGCSTGLRSQPTTSIPTSGGVSDMFPDSCSEPWSEDLAT